MKLKVALCSLLAIVALAIPASSVFAYTVPNLVAVTTPDHQVAVTYAGFATRDNLNQAGAFATMMTQAHGLDGIPNFEPTTLSDSQIVCQVPVAGHDAIWVVYGIQGYGVQEGIGFCGTLENDGYPVQWRLGN